MKSKILFPVSNGLVLLWCTLSYPTYAAMSPAEFVTDVKPILETHCLKCHGGDKVRAGFQISSRELVLHGGELGPAVDLATPEKSHILEFISYTGEHVMPPKGKLPDETIATLTRWIKAGLPWEGPPLAPPRKVHKKASITDEDRAFWAYATPAPASPPEVSDPLWQANPIDRFIRHQLDAQGLPPSPPAAPRAWLRRVTYDLTGLPPSSADYTAFEADHSPAARARIVDALLASPHYGERWGRHWLDVVRYAESNGYERDSTKPFIWRYRDYVIKSFNDDKPYARFLQEQLAGDELFPANTEALTATGFYRLGTWDDEPADRAQAHFDNLDDILSTVTGSMLAMTLNCARCHDHKIDPLLQRDYYQMLAFFNNINENLRGDPKKLLHQVVSDPATHAASLKKQAEDLAAARARTTQLRASVRARWNTHATGPALKAGRPLAGMGTAEKAKPMWHYRTSPPTADWSEVGYRPGSDWKKGVAGFGTNGTPGSRIGTTWQSTDIWLHRTFRLDRVPQQLVLRIHHDEDVEVHLNGGLIFTRKGFRADYTDVPLDEEAVALLQTGRNTLAIHCKQTVGGQYVDAGLYIPGAAALPPFPKLVKEHKGFLTTEEEKTWRSAFDHLRRVEQAKPEGITQISAVAEFGDTSPAAHILIRGSAHAKGDPVQPGFPKVLSKSAPAPRALPLPTAPGTRKTTGRRKQLAQWITQPGHPLTHRVMANRIWQHHFGRGIVDTPNDFGLLGSRPTHPELLNWLAEELEQNGGHLKPLHRLIVLSQSYALSSQAHEKGLAEDPANQHFWRFNMRRLGAEEIRDTLLRVTDELNPMLFGPSIYPKLAPEVLATASKGASVWRESSPEDQRRRSIYIHVKRSLVVPTLQTFDFADTDTSCPVRFETTIPAQALSFLNSPFVNTQASTLASRARSAAADPVGQVNALFTFVLGRPASDTEHQTAVQLQKDMQEQHQLSAAAAFDRLALLVLNLNELIYLD